ncbi:MAG TPA: Hint domain-containing protein [Candidatus Binatia bacterium]|nr:Hint domain-containing protein [Candidatus Binatia bacterium]
MPMLQSSAICQSIDRRTRLAWTLAVLVLAVAGCTGLGGSPAPTPGPTTTPGPVRTAGELRLLLIERLGPRWYCDPDSFPVSRDEQQSAIDRYDEMVADADTFRAVAAQLGIDPAGPHDDAEKLALYRRWKVAASIPLDPIGDGRYRFDYLAEPAPGASEGTRTAGIVDERGTITVEQQAPAGEPICPICLDRRSTIDTPAGPIAVERLALGDVVWTLDRDGRRVPGTVIALGRTSAPRGHEVIRLTLADGRSVTASPGHPLADGRPLAVLRVGDALDGSSVTAVERIAYDRTETFDIAVSGETGVYFADGIPLGSTLD